MDTQAARAFVRDKCPQRVIGRSPPAILDHQDIQTRQSGVSSKVSKIREQTAHLFQPICVRNHPRDSGGAEAEKVRRVAVPMRARRDSQDAQWSAWSAIPPTGTAAEHTRGTVHVRLRSCGRGTCRRGRRVRKGARVTRTWTVEVATGRRNGAPSGERWSRNGRRAAPRCECTRRGRCSSATIRRTGPLRAARSIGRPGCCPECPDCPQGSLTPGATGGGITRAGSAFSSMRWNGAATMSRPRRSATVRHCSRWSASHRSSSPRVATKTRLGSPQIRSR